MRTLRVLFLASLLAACGDDDDAPGTTTGPVAAADFPTRASAAFCKALSSCCPAAGVSYDAQGCQGQPVVDQGKWNDILSVTSITYSAEAAGACVASIESSCPGSDDILELPACRGVLTGNLAAGTACTIDPECAAPSGQRAACYHAGGGSSPGVCVVITTDVPAGAACDAAAGSICAAGLYCDSTGRCVASLALGSPCTFSDDCLGGTCSLATQTCVAHATVGQPCDPFCADDAYCQLKDASGDDAVCASVPCPEGVCVARKAQGSACVVREECTGSLRCVGGRCEPESFYSCSAEEDSAPGN